MAALLGGHFFCCKFILGGTSSGSLLIIVASHTSTEEPLLAGLNAIFKNQDLPDLERMGRNNRLQSIVINHPSMLALVRHLLHGQSPIPHHLTQSYKS